MSFYIRKPGNGSGLFFDTSSPHVAWSRPLTRFRNYLEAGSCLWSIHLLRSRPGGHFHVWSGVRSSNKSIDLTVQRPVGVGWQISHMSERSIWRRGPYGTGNTTDRILFHNKRALTSREPRLQLCYERCPALCKPSNYPTYGCCVCSSAETIQAYIYAIVMHYSRVVKCRRICRVTACSHLSTNVADTIKTSPTSCRTAGRHFWRSTNHCKRRSATPIRLARARLACFDW